MNEKVLNPQKVKAQVLDVITIKVVRRVNADKDDMGKIYWRILLV